MQRAVTLVTLVVLTIFAVGCTGRGGDFRASAEVDSIVTNAVDSCIVADDAGRALAIIDSAEADGAISHANAELWRSNVFCHNESTIDTARAILERLVRQEDLTAEHQAYLYGKLIHVARLRHDDESALKYGTQYVEVCHQLEWETEALSVQADLGEILVRTGRPDEGLAMMDDAIAQLDRVRRFFEMDACVLAMKRKIKTLLDLERYEEAVPLGERIVAKLADYGEHPDDYADGSSRLPTDERRPGYIDFYTGQAYAFMAYAYAMESGKMKVESEKMADALKQSNNNAITQSRHYLALFNQTDYSRTFGGRKLISSTWCRLGMYDQMLAFYDELQQKWGADTLHNDYAIMLTNRATAARAAGHYRESDSYMKRYAELQKYLNDAERLAAAQEYAARYHEQERQMELQKTKNSRRTVGVIATLLGVLVLGLTFFVYVLLRQRRDIRQKNAVLTKEIADRMEYEELYHQTLAASAAASAKEPTPEELAVMGDASLFELLRDVITREQLYLDPAFGRENLESRFRISKERLGAAFAHGSPYGSIQGFLGEIRLQHAAKLLAEQPDLPIADVATQSGFASYVVFARNFKQRFALTPTDFRKKNA